MIELLVTLVIVAILLGVLLPALQQARASAEKTQCLSSKASNGRSLLMHIFERDGQFPPMFHAVSPGQSDQILVHVQPRTPEAAGINHMDEASLICPSDQDRGTVPLQRNDGVIHQVMSYGYNIELSIKEATLDKLDQPAHTSVLFDGSMSGPNSGPNVEGGYPDSYAFVERAHRPRHKDTVNVLFADWHARNVDQIEPGQVVLP